MKAIKFYGNTLDQIKSFPVTVRQAVGYELDRV